METQLLRLVNAGLAGEPERIVLQNTETNTIYEFSQVVNETIANGDLSHPVIQQILQTGHTIQATVDENFNVTLLY
jgi:hypothetical protein